LATTGDAYSQNARFWVQIIREKLDRYRTELTDAAVLTALGELEGKNVLDGGCGEGYLSREIHQRGATVTGLDVSTSLIEAASSERDRLGLTRLKHYVAGLEAIPEDDATFDAVVCNHVMTDVEDAAEALKEIGRVTKIGGKLVILMLHPCFYTAHAERNASGTIPVDRYFNTRNISQNFKVAGVSSPDKVHMNFRPLEYHTSAILQSGYTITGLTEPHPSPEQFQETWWNENFVKPLFMLIVAERVPRRQA
jgi:2-polyprenyl-3-methyl-5-hydroxy-6-metoxy-1,4-benzoquinol methylase